VVAVLSAGNLATTQAVVTALRETAGSGRYGQDLHAARTMYDGAMLLGASCVR
jgi:putative proteasome-type protease